MHITVDTIIGDILRRETEAAAFFKEAGMHCIECPRRTRRNNRRGLCSAWYGCRAVRSSI